MKILFQLSRGTGIWSCFMKKSPEIFDGAQETFWGCFLYSKLFQCINKEYVLSGTPVSCLEKHRSPSTTYFSKACCEIWGIWNKVTNADSHTFWVMYIKKHQVNQVNQKSTFKFELWRAHIQMCIIWRIDMKVEHTWTNIHEKV